MRCGTPGPKIIQKAVALCQSTLLEPEVAPGQYPMYVVPFEYFMNMRSVKSHQELLSSKILVEFVPEMGDSIFVSHQWAGATHPDINFDQLRVLQRALDQMMGGQVLLKSGHQSFVFLGHGEYISTREWRSNSLFIWYDYFSCPQLVARSTAQEDIQELQGAVDSIPHYVQACRYFVVLAPCIKHADTGDLMSKEGWQSRGWCRFERVCREFLCPDSNIAVIESPQHWYVMTPFDSWLRPACMGLFTVEDDRDKVQSLISGMFRTKLVSCLRHSELQTYRMVLNLQHVYIRKKQLGIKRTSSTKSLVLGGKTQLSDFMKENGFESATDCQFGWSPACFAALRGDVQVLKELLAGRVNVNDRIRADEKKFHLEKGMSLLMICAQFCNNVCMRLLLEQRADVNLRDRIGATAIHRAGIGNNAEGIRMLVQARCNPHQGDTFGHNALLPICGWGSIDSLRALLEMAPGIKMHRALHVAVFGEGAPAQIIPELLLAGVDINEPLSFSLKTRFQLHVLARLAKWVDRRHGNDLFFVMTNAIGATPLIMSLLTRSFHAAAILISAGADVGLTNAAGRTAMDVAELVWAPDFIYQGLRGFPEACDTHVHPSVAEKIWVSF